MVCALEATSLQCIGKVDGKRIAESGSETPVRDPDGTAQVGRQDIERPAGQYSTADLGTRVGSEAGREVNYRRRLANGRND